MIDEELIAKIRAEYSDCENCPDNWGIKEGGAHIAGPCGQQNCWGDIYISRILEDKDEND